MQTASLGEGTYRKNRASPGTDDATAPGPTTPIGKCANAFEVPATVLADFRTDSRMRSIRGIRDRRAAGDASDAGARR
jgi:hypothetical protein